jgi:hypothetical protein
MRYFVLREGNMELYDKIRARLKGSAEEKKRREEILKYILDTFRQGSPETVMNAMKSRLDDMEKQLTEKLVALKKKL